MNPLNTPLLDAKMFDPGHMSGRHISNSKTPNPQYVLIGMLIHQTRGQGLFKYFFFI